MTTKRYFLCKSIRKKISLPFRTIIFINIQLKAFFFYLPLPFRINHIFKQIKAEGQYIRSCQLTCENFVLLCISFVNKLWCDYIAWQTSIDKIYATEHAKPKTSSLITMIYA